MSQNIHQSQTHAQVLIRGEKTSDRDPELGAKIQFLKKLELTDNINGLNILQRSVWPHVVQGRNCIIVGGKNGRKGKSLSYLLPVVVGLNELKSQLRAEIVKGKVGPAALIITGNYKSAEKVLSKLRNLVSGTGLVEYMVNGTEGYGRLSDKLFEHQPEIIVTTLNNVDYMLKKFYDVFRFDRLRYLVFDDCHLIFNNETEYTQSFMANVVHYTSELNIKYQTIFCGNAWDDMMASAACNLMSHLDPVVIINNPLAALNYGGVNVKIHVVDMFERAQYIAQLVADSEEGKYVIVAEKSIAVDLLAKEFKNQNLEFLTIDDKDKTIIEREAKTNYWNTLSEGKRVLLITDDTLGGVPIEGTTHVLHFDVPFTNPEDFWSRHNSMWTNFPTLCDFMARFPDNANEKVLESHVFISDNDNCDKFVLSFIKLGFSVPEELRQRVIKADLAELSKHVLCEALINIGKCYDTDCKKRHFFNEDEIKEEPTVPRIGRVELEIISAIDVNLFIGKIIRTYLHDGTNASNHVSYLTLRTKIESQLEAVFADETNRPRLQTVNVGVICAIQDREGKLFRAKVVTVFKQNTETGVEIENVRVFLLDHGTYCFVRPDELFEIPKVLCLAKASAVEVIIANLQPRGRQPHFSQRSRAFAKEWIGKTVTGTVALSIGNRVWFTSLREWFKTSSGHWYNETNMRTDFIKNRKCAWANPTHLENLYKLAEEKGLDCTPNRPQTNVSNEEATAEEQEDQKSPEIDEEIETPEIQAQLLQKYNEQYDQHVREQEDDEDEDDLDPDRELDIWFPSGHDDPEEIADLFHVGLQQLVTGLAGLNIPGFEAIEEEE